MGTDDFTSVERPRTRRLLSVVAVIVPVAVFVGAAAWFIRVYIAPPTIAISEPIVLAALDTVQVMEPALPTPIAETNDASNPASEPLLPMVATLVFAPFAAAPEPPNAILDAAEEPITGPVPLPQPRPRISTAAIRAPVPLPRPRPPH